MAVKTERTWHLAVVDDETKHTVGASNKTFLLAVCGLINALRADVADVSEDDDLDFTAIGDLFEALSKVAVEFDGWESGGEVAMAMNGGKLIWRVDAREVEEQRFGG